MIKLLCFVAFALVAVIVLAMAYLVDSIIEDMLFGPLVIAICIVICWICVGVCAAIICWEIRVLLCGS